MTQIINGEIRLGEQTKSPQSLDELFSLVESGEGNWRFTLPAPVMTWGMVRDLARCGNGQGTLEISGETFAWITGQNIGTGTLRISEDQLFAILIAKAFDAAYNHGQNCLGTMPGEKLVIWGQAVYEIIDALKPYVVSDVGK